MACNKCKEVECTCVDNSCSPVDAKCVIYRPEGISELNCIADIPAGTNLEELLHIWDEYFCGLFTIPILTCVKEKLGIAVDVDTMSPSQLLTSIQNWICNTQDVKVKASSGDTSNGYLFDKLEEGECIILSISQNEDTGVQKVKIDIDWPCLIRKIPTCFTIENNDCIVIDNGVIPCIPQPLVPVISRTNSTLTGVNCNGSLQWYTSNGVLVGVGNNFTAAPNTSYYAKCATVCGESGASNTVNVPNIVTFSRTRTSIFVRNNCGNNPCNIPCIGSSVPFTKTYTSNVSQAVVDAMAENDQTFAIEGQANANALGTCTCLDCNCVFPTYNSNIVINNPTCSGSVINANGQITIVGITNANRFGWSIGSGDYSGVSYNDAIVLQNFNQGNIEVTSSSIKLKSLSIETRVVFRLYNQSNTCFTDVVVTLTPPDCSQEQVDIEDVDVLCTVDDVQCKNWTIVAGSTGSNIWHLNCLTGQYVFTEILANTTTQVCSALKPQVTGGVVTENGVC